MRQVIQRIGLALMGIAMLSQSALAGDTYWDVVDGNWSTGSNWTAGEPTATDNAYVDNDGVVRLVYSEVCDHLYMGYGTGIEKLYIYNLGNLTANRIRFGMNGHAQVSQSAGLVDTANGIDIGYSDTATYTLSSGAQLTTGGDMSVGKYGGDGELTISGGADASCQWGYIARNFAASSGTVLVDGTDSTWTMTHSLYVGGYGGTEPGGTATLTIDNAGLVDAATLMQVWDAGTVNVANGTLNADAVNMLGGATMNTNVNSALDLGDVTLNGDGTTWTHTDDIYIHATGDAASLAVQDGAALTTNKGYLGYYTGTVGSASVTGVGAQWDAGSHLYVGRYGNGALTIASDTYAYNGEAKVTCTYGYIGRYSTSNSAVVVGADASYSTTSIWDIGSALSIGTGGTGKLTINRDGLVEVDGPVTLGSGGTVELEAGSELWADVIDVSGGGSIFGAGDLYVNQLVGFGASVNLPNMDIYFSHWHGSSTAEHTVGAGQSFTCDYLEIGEIGHATFTIQDGGTTNVDDLQIGDNYNHTGTVTVTGTGSTLNVAGYLEVANEGHGVLDILNGGVVNAGSVNICPFISAMSATATVDGTNSALNATGSIVLDDFQGAGTLNVRNNGTATWGAGSKLKVVRDSVVNVEDGTIDGGHIELLDGGTLNTTGFSTINTDDVVVRGVDAYDGDRPSRWAHTSTAKIDTAGSSLTPIVSVEEGGRFESNYGFVGYYSGQSGTVGVTNASSTWVVANNLTVGYYGTGNLLLTDGGSASCDSLDIGRKSSGSGTVEIGSGTTGISTLTVSGDVNLGVVGTGVLRTHTWSELRTEGTFTIGVNGTLDMHHGGIYADRIVLATGATMPPTTTDGWWHFNELDGFGDNINFPDLGMTLGSIGATPGTHTIGATQQINCQEFHLGTSSSGTLSVEGDLDATNRIQVGTNNTSELVIVGGGDVTTSGEFRVHEYGTLRMTGTVGGSNWARMYCDELRMLTGGTIDMTTGSSIRTNAITGFGSHVDFGGVIILGVDIGSTPAALAIGPGQTFKADWNFAIAESRNATLTITGGGQVTCGTYGGVYAVNSGVIGSALVSGSGSSWTGTQFFFVGSDSGDGILTIDNGGYVQADDMTIGANAGMGLLTVQGSLSHCEITRDLDVGSNSFTGSGTVTLDGGVTSVADSLTIFTSGTVNLQGGTLSAGTIDHTHGGTFNCDSGHLAVSNFLGHLEVDGGAWLHPGQSVGTTAVSSGLQMLPASILAIEIDGVNSSDLLDVTGTAILNNNKLSIQLVDGFFPLYGNQWMIMRVTGGITGTAIAPTGYAISFNGDSTKMYLIRTAPNLLGDANNDGVVSADDFAAVQGHFGNVGTTDGSLLGDANDDGVVSADDFAAIQAHFGDVAPYSTEVDPIPEPATIALLSLAGVALTRRRPWQTLRR